MRNETANLTNATNCDINLGIWTVRIHASAIITGERLD